METNTLSGKVDDPSDLVPGSKLQYNLNESREENNIKTSASPPK